MNEQYTWYMQSSSVILWDGSLAHPTPPPASARGNHMDVSPHKPNHQLPADSRNDQALATQRRIHMETCG